MARRTEHRIEPHVTVLDASESIEDGTFSRDDFTYDHVSSKISILAPPARCFRDRLNLFLTKRHYATARASMTAKPAA